MRSTQNLISRKRHNNPKIVKRSMKGGFLGALLGIKQPHTKTKEKYFPQIYDIIQQINTQLKPDLIKFCSFL